MYIFNFQYFDRSRTLGTSYIICTYADVYYLDFLYVFYTMLRMKVVYQNSSNLVLFTLAIKDYIDPVVIINAIKYRKTLFLN